MVPPWCLVSSRSPRDGSMLGPWCSCHGSMAFLCCSHGAPAVTRGIPTTLPGGYLHHTCPSRGSVRSGQRAPAPVATAACFDVATAAMGKIDPGHEIGTWKGGDLKIHAYQSAGGLKKHKPMVVSWWINGGSVVGQWFFRDVSMVRSWCSHGAFMVPPCILMVCVPMVPWCRGGPMVPLWTVGSPSAELARWASGGSAVPP